MFRFRIKRAYSPDRVCGFTLLEVVVAFTVLAVSLGAIFYAFGTGATNAALSERYTIATLLAESQLAATGVETPLVFGASEGKLTDGYRWRQTVSPIGNSTAEPSKRQTAQLYEVVLEVLWDESGKTRSVSLRTHRIGMVQ